MNYLYLFLIFFKVGIIGFGGGYAILPLIYQDVQNFGIMSADEFSNLVALSQVTPGPIAVNAATYVGFKVAGLSGACMATFAVALPSFILCLLVLAFLDRFKTNTTVQSILAGIRPATVGLMASAFIFMAQTALWPIAANSEAQGITHSSSLTDYVSGLAHDFMQFDVVAVIIFLLTFGLILLRRFGAITLTLLGGALGVVLSHIMG